MRVEIFSIYSLEMSEFSLDAELTIAVAWQDANIINGNTAESDRMAATFNGNLINSVG